MNIVIECWFYAKNCIFEHMTNKNFSRPQEPSETTCPQPKVKVLELPLSGSHNSVGQWVGCMTWTIHAGWVIGEYEVRVYKHEIFSLIAVSISWHIVRIILDGFDGAHG